MSQARRDHVPARKLRIPFRPETQTLLDRREAVPRNLRAPVDEDALCLGHGTGLEGGTQALRDLRLEHERAVQLMPLGAEELMKLRTVEQLLARQAGLESQRGQQMRRRG